MVPYVDVSLFVHAQLSRLTWCVDRLSQRLQNLEHDKLRPSSFAGGLHQFHGVPGSAYTSNPEITGMLPSAAPSLYLPQKPAPETELSQLRQAVFDMQHEFRAHYTHVNATLVLLENRIKAIEHRQLADPPNADRSARNQNNTLNRSLTGLEQRLPQLETSLTSKSL